MNDTQGKESNHNKVKAYISEITFNNGETLSIEPNDIVLFVGPNNAGKSQSLNDIYIKCGGTAPTIVVSHVKTQKDKGSILELIKSVTKVYDRGNQYVFSINGNSFGFDKTNGEDIFKQTLNYGSYRDLFVCKLSTENRLSICNPVNIINRDQALTHPIHYAAFKTEYAEWISDNFYKAFGKNLTAHSQHGATIPLCIS